MRKPRKRAWITITTVVAGAALALLAWPRSAQANGAVIYMDQDATGAATGLSWTDAYTNLQAGLSAAAAGDEIWVAAGVYTPTNVANQSAAFYLKSGVELYGGFDSSETHRDQRDWQTHVTVLSGDLYGNDTTNADGVSTHWSHISGYNSRQVVIGSSADNAAVLDGFTITGGAAT